MTGLFFFGAEVFDTIKRTELSEDGSVGLSDMLRQFIWEGRLRSEKLNGDIQWFDTGTPERMYLAGSAVRSFQRSHAVFAGSIEEAAFDSGLISSSRLLEISSEMNSTVYGRHLAERGAKVLKYE